MGTELQLFNPTLPIGSLDAYLQRIDAIPLLTQVEEQALAERFQQQGDLKAAQQLVLSHLRYVVRVAKGYSGYGLPLSDLIQEGTIGLMKAVKRFDPGVGVRLVSFAVHWIKAEIHEFVLRNWRIVKIATTKAQRKLFFNLRSAKKRLGWFTREEVEAVAQDLGVRPLDVQHMEARLNNYDVTFDMPSNADDESKALAPIEYLEAPNANPLEALSADNGAVHSSVRLRSAFTKLDPRSQDIVQKRWLEDSKTTLQDLALTYKVSLERIRQLEKNAMKKLKELMQEESPCFD